MWSCRSLRGRRAIARRRFNEAEASLPRNACAGGRCMWGRRGCFNEAEASLPRNAGRHDLAGRPDISRKASMRPRQACLGMPCSDWLDCEVWPHASMRPRQACLGMPGVTDVYYTPSTHASMRPRQACLGMPTRRRRMIKSTECASMRPRQACLGMPASQTTGGGVMRIRFNEAEASLPRNARWPMCRTRSSCQASMRPRQACLGMRGNIWL